MRAPPDVRRGPATTPDPDAKAATATNGTTSGLSVTDGPVAGVVDLAEARARRAQAEGELPAGPAVCPPRCPWCYAPNWLGGSRVRRWRSTS